LVALQSDYIEAIDGDVLMRLAEQHDLLLTLEHRPGDFAVAGEVIARVYPAENVADDVRAAITGAFIFGPERTQTQDPEFMLNELVEIAVRALSPGINDPTTAALCVDRLGAALAKVAAGEMPSRARFDQTGRLRIVVKRYGFRGLVEAAFNPIRQYGRSSVSVTIRLLETIARIALHVHRDEDRETLLRHAEMIESGSRQAEMAHADEQDVQERYRAALVALGRSRRIEARSAA
jgi:uncharacterized membrane protein